MPATAAAVRQKLQRIDELCAQDALPIRQVDEVYGVTVPAKEGGTGEVALVLVCQPKPSRSYQPMYWPEFAFFEQFVGQDSIMDEQESWFDCQFEPDDHRNALWKRFSTPAAAVGEIVDKIIREAKECQHKADHVQRVLSEASGPEGLQFYDQLITRGDAATRLNLLHKCAGWLQGLRWEKCFYTQSNRPSLSSWKGSPWECDNVVDKLLPKRNKIGVELVVSDCQDEALKKKFGQAPWRRAHFDGVPEKYIIQLRKGGAQPTNGAGADNCQAFWDLLDSVANAGAATASSSGAGMGKAPAGGKGRAPAGGKGKAPAGGKGKAPAGGKGKPPASAKRDVDASPATGSGAAKKHKAVTERGQQSMEAFLSQFAHRPK